MTLMTIIWSRSDCIKTYDELCKNFHLSHHFASLLLTCHSDTQTKQNVILKTASDFLLRNERDILKRFQIISSLRRLIDEIQDSSLLVLKHLDSDLLIESTTNKLQSSKVKHVTKTVLQALAALHKKEIIYMSTWKVMITAHRHIISDFWWQMWNQIIYWSTIVTVKVDSAISNWRIAKIAHMLIS